ncbi:MAG: ABC1 kinase family protein [Candidatus Bipolaricaulia bacterium]
MRLSRLPRAYSGLRRYRQILTVLIKYGFGDLLGRLKVRHPLLGRLPRLRAVRELEDLSRPERLRLAFEELGPTFIKLGQLLSLRPDLLPSEYAAELAKLQDEAVPLSFAQIKGKVEAQLGHSLKGLFREFAEEPLAAASLAQVHRAVLGDGTEVAIKVQRPGIREVIRADLIILEDLAHFLVRHLPESEPFDPPGLVREFAKTLKRELDFVREGRNMELFRRNFQGDPTIYIPKVFWEYTTPEVLTMERIEGVKITDLEGLEQAGLDRHQVALNGANAILKQVFEHGLFHADPHPGNILVLEGNVIAPLDFGMVGRIDVELRERVGQLLLGIARGDLSGLVRTLRELGSLDERVDLGAFRTDLADLLDRYSRTPLYRLELGRLLDELMALVREYRLRLPTNLVMMGKALVIAEGVGRALDPEIELLALARPYLERLAIRRGAFQRALQGWGDTLAEGRELLQEFPAGLRAIMGKLRRGELRAQLDLSGFDRLVRELDRASNRLAFALIIAALIVGSSLVMQLEVGPRLWGLPLFGFLGFGFAAILGFWLVIAILRSGRL